MPDVTVPVTFVQQEKVYYCGPAVAQMTLAALGVPPPLLPPPPTWQDSLWADVQANTGAIKPKGWSSTPHAIEAVVTMHQTVAVYASSKHRTEAAATTEMLNTLDHGLPGLPLINGWQHWVVMDGYKRDETGSSVVGGRNLNGVYIRDPLTNLPFIYVTWPEWRDAYLQFISCGDYLNTIVVIGATRVAAPPPQAPPPTAPTGIRIIVDELRRGWRFLLARLSRWS